jgi:hypothetical protein
MFRGKEQQMIDLKGHTSMQINPNRKLEGKGDPLGDPASTATPETAVPTSTATSTVTTGTPPTSSSTTVTTGTPSISSSATVTTGTPSNSEPAINAPEPSCIPPSYAQRTTFPECIKRVRKIRRKISVEDCKFECQTHIEKSVLRTDTVITVIVEGQACIGIKFRELSQFELIKLKLRKKKLNRKKRSNDVKKNKGNLIQTTEESETGKADVIDESHETGNQSETGEAEDGGTLGTCELIIKKESNDPNCNGTGISKLPQIGKKLVEQKKLDRRFTFLGTSSKMIRLPAQENDTRLVFHSCGDVTKD